MEKGVGSLFTMLILLGYPLKAGLPFLHRRVCNQEDGGDRMAFTIIIAIARDSQS